MSFLYPHLAWLLVVAPLAVVALAAYANRQRSATARRIGELLGGLTVGASARRRWTKTALVATAAFFMALALMRPRYGMTPRDGHAEGLDLVVALDVSKSMLAEDVSPSRLERAKAELSRLLDDLDGDRVALVLFAGDAFLQTPLTSDAGALRMFLDNASPDDLPTPGTDFGVAIDVALDAFGTKSPEGVRTPSRVVLFVSDGENHVANLAEIKARAEEQGVTLLAAGMGERDGAPIPDGQGGVKTDSHGQPVSTRLEDAALRDLASGNYVHVGRTGTLAGPVEAMLDRLERTALEADPFVDYAEQFMWPLALALALLLIDLGLDERPPSPTLTDVPTPVVASSPKVAAAPTTLAVVALFVFAGCGARRDGLAGNRAVLFNDYDAAVTRYTAGLDRQQADGDTLSGSVRMRLFHNLGVALLMTRNAALSDGAAQRPLDSLARTALRAFDRAFDASPSDRLRHTAIYNGGLAAVATGDAPGALFRFRTALRFDPSDEDAAYNWEYVARNRRDRSGGGDGDGNNGQNPPESPNGDGKQQTERDAGEPKPGDPSSPQPDPNGDEQHGQQQAEDGQPQAPSRLSPEEAARILDAIGQEEGQVRRQLRRRPEAPVRVEKDW